MPPIALAYILLHALVRGGPGDMAVYMGTWQGLFQGCYCYNPVALSIWLSRNHPESDQGRKASCTLQPANKTVNVNFTFIARVSHVPLLTTKHSVQTRV
jgi:hypothetical protein